MIRAAGAIGAVKRLLVAQLSRIVTERVIDGLTVNQASINRKIPQTIFDLCECPFDHRGLPRGNLLTPIDSLVSTGYRLAIQEAG